MTRVALNGKDLSIEFSPQAPLKEFIEYLRRKVTNEQNLVSAIYVNGVELTYSRETEFATIPWTDLQSLEIFTTYSRELIDDTLQHLMQYSTFLNGLSKDTAALIGTPEFHINFHDLIDGISTLSDGISSVKQMLHADKRPKVAGPEVELLDILRDLFQHYQSGNTPEIQKILEERLPGNLEIWKNSGIPDLVHISSN